jgi:hypothetical protein
MEGLISNPEISKTLENVFVSKIGKTGISKTFNGFLKINLENWYLEKCVRN